MSNTGVEYQLSLKDLFSSKIKSATSATEKLNNRVSGLQSSFSSIAGALGIGLGVAGAVSFGKSVIESLKNYEYFSASLRTLMKGDALASKALEGQLVKLASTSPFSLVEVQDATKQLISYGFSAGSVTKNISMLGDVASALKIPFGDIAYLYGTLKTQGRAYARDIMQFTQRGIPITRELSKQLKVSESAVMGLVSAGKIGFPEVEKAFKSMTSEGGQFFNMMSEQSKTVGGQISNLGDNWEQLKVNIGKSQTGIIAGTVSLLNTFTGWVSGNIAQLNRFEEAQIAFNGRTKNRFDSFMDGLGSFLSFGMAKGSDIKFLELDQSLQKSLGNADNIVKKMQLKADLTKQLGLEMIRGQMGITDSEETKGRRASIKQALATLQGEIGLMGKTDSGGSTPAKGKAGKAGTSMDAVETRGHQNFNIEIDKLIETLNFNTTNLKDSANTVKGEVTKALIGAVNDFQLMATK